MRTNFSSTALAIVLGSVCLLMATGCGWRSSTSDPQAAKKLLSDTLEAWKQGKKPDDLQQLTPPVYVNDLRWQKAAKLTEFTVTSDGEYHQSSVRIPVRMKTDKDPKPRQVFYWVSTNPAKTVTLSEM